MRYTFAATVAENWVGNQHQLQIVPDDFDALVEFYRRDGITTDPYWHPNGYVTVNRRDLVARAEGASRVHYTLEGRDVRGVRRWAYALGLEPIE
jgi:hypothetical protein